MHTIRIGAAVLNQTPMAWESNQRNISDAIDAAREQGVAILCLPELCITGYGCEDAFLSRDLQATAWQILTELAPQTDGMAVAISLPVFVQSGIFDAAAMVIDGRIRGLVAKQYLPADGLHYEPRWFRAWPAGQQTTITRGGREIPFGDLLFDCRGVRIGVEICEDAWVASRPGLAQAREGVDVILNPSASHFAFGKHRIRKRFVLEGSRFFGVGYAFANLLGNEAGRAIYDGDALVAAGGELLATVPRFSFADLQLTAAQVDLDRCRLLRTRAGGIQPATGAPRPGLVRCDARLPTEAPAVSPPVGGDPWPDSKEEEFTRATALGLRDYIAKTHSNGAVVSLSGGADSAAVACLLALMTELAIAELGREGFAAKLPAVRGLAAATDNRAAVGALLTTVYQATANSSETTRAAARQLAEALGTRHLELDVEGLVRGYVERIEAATGRSLDWQHDDLALQNIQARVRAPSVWLLANLESALLLATSNRSEVAVGYATMDGDTCGGLSPIAGIDKTSLREWLRWLEQDGPHGLDKLPALAAINCQQPTAELRPADRSQTDEADLMPYPVLDAIERAAIRDKQSPVEVLARLTARFGEHDRTRLAEWVERFFRLWARNQWKRERYAPSFHLDDENLDPKTWCRFPILSGGYEREITALRAAIEADAGG